MLERDWQTDYDWVNSPDVCISERTQELANYWLLRAKELEEENHRLKAYEEGQFWLKVREGAEKLAEENRKLREALERIANAEPGDTEGGAPGMTSEACYVCEELIDVAREALGALDGKEEEDDHLPRNEREN